MNETNYRLILTGFADEADAELSDSLSASDSSEQTSLTSSTGLNPLDWENIKPTLKILWQGLLAIFVVIGIIIAIVSLINFCIAKAEHAKSCGTIPGLPRRKKRKNSARRKKKPREKIRAEKRTKTEFSFPPANRSNPCRRHRKTVVLPTDRLFSAAARYCGG